MAQISLHTNSAFAVRALNHANSKSQSAVKKLSTGKRINKAGDDVAGVSIAAKLDRKLRGFDKAIQNLSDGLSQIDAHEQYLSSAQERFQSLHELAIKALNGTNSEDELAAMQREWNEIIESLDGGPGFGVTPKRTNYWNGQAVSDPDRDLIIQGADDNNVAIFIIEKNGNPNEGIQVEKTDDGDNGEANEGGLVGKAIAEYHLGSQTVNSLHDPFNKQVLLDDDIKNIIDNISRIRNDLGAYKNSINTKIAFYEEQKISYSGYKSHVMDTDIAEESTAFAREQLRSQTASAMLTQANSQGQVALSLLP